MTSAIGSCNTECREQMRSDRPTRSIAFFIGTPRQLKLLSHFELTRHKLGQQLDRNILPLPLRAAFIPRISQKAKMLNAKSQRFPRDFPSQTIAATKYEIFFCVSRSSAHCSLLLPCIKTSEQLTNGFEHTSQVRQFIAGVAEMFSSVLSKVAARFIRDQRGATMLEYGLLVGLVAIAAIIAVTAMGGALSTMFSNAAAEL